MSLQKQDISTEEYSGEPPLQATQTYDKKIGRGIVVIVGDCLCLGVVLLSLSAGVLAAALGLARLGTSLVHLVEKVQAGHL
jgi:hypothetical protein